MKRYLVAASAACLMLTLTAGAFAADGWSMPNLNPFAKKYPGPAKARASDSGWKMPSLWPKSNTAARSPAAGPSTWQKMTNSTKSAMSKTADFLNPFDDANDLKATDPSPTGYNKQITQSPDKKQTDAKQASWWGGEAEQPKRAQTVNDFLSQPKPEF